MCFETNDLNSSPRSTCDLSFVSLPGPDRPDPVWPGLGLAHYLTHLMLSKVTLFTFYIPIRVSFRGMGWEEVDSGQVIVMAREDEVQGLDVSFFFWRIEMFGEK